MKNKDINIVQGVCSECGSHGLCNQNTELCLKCDEMYNGFNSLEKDFKLDGLMIKLKIYKEKKERLINICKKIIDDYQEKIDNYQNQIDKQEDYIKSIFLAMINKKDMEEKKTQFKYVLPSGNIIIKKSNESLKLKNEYDMYEIPEKYIKCNYSVDWKEFKKHLTISAGKVINSSTGEILKSVNILKNPEQIIINLNDMEDVEDES